MSLILKIESHTQQAPIDQEAKLIQRCLDNDRLAQKELYQTYYPSMMALCKRYYSQPDDCLEILNLGFLKVYQSLKNFKQQSQLKTWIYTLIFRTIMDKMRADMRRVRTAEISQTEIEISIEPTIIDQMHANEILALLQHLPMATRTVFNLFAIENYTHKQIAQELAISEGTSKWHVNQARLMLKDLIAKHYETR